MRLAKPTARLKPTTATVFFVLLIFSTLILSYIGCQYISTVDGSPPEFFANLPTGRHRARAPLDGSRPCRGDGPPREARFPGSPSAASGGRATDSPGSAGRGGCGLGNPSLRFESCLPDRDPGCRARSLRPEEASGRARPRRPPLRSARGAGTHREATSGLVRRGARTPFAPRGREGSNRPD